MKHSPECSYSRSSKYAFTLVELLAVIGIIGILAAIIIPVVGKVRESAKTATASSNIRQVTLAVLGNAAENRGLISIQSDWVPGIKMPPYWSATLTNTYLSRGDKNAAGIFADPFVDDSGATGGRSHYSMNGLFMTEGKVLFRRPTLVQRPASTVLLLDGTMSTATRTACWDAATAVDGGNWSLPGDPQRLINPGPDLKGESSRDGGTPVGGNISWRMPGGRAKFSFCDGHVQIMRPSEVRLRHLNGLLD